ncbi:MAG: TonB-dependent receptor [Bacteroidetes bacterium]|nr:TonB-dependent receptor [Bacteroidota bacterium]
MKRAFKFFTQKAMIKVRVPYDTIKINNFKQMKYSTQIILYLLISGLNVLGQNNPKIQKDTTLLTEEIKEITITAFRSPYNLFNTPAPINLITAQQLETGSSFTPIEALNQVPGVLMHHGTFNTNRLTIRGIGSRTLYATNKIKAYFGEIPLTSGDGETTLEDIENSAINRIELIKGPSSSLYGAGLAGVILFHPKSVLKNFVQNQTSIASFGTVKNTLTAGIISNNLNIFALGSALKSNGFRENNKTNRSNFLINSQYSFSARSNLQVLLKSTAMKAFIPSSLNLPGYQNSPEKAASNWQNIEGFEEYTNGQFGISFNYFTPKNEKISVATFGSFRVAEELRPFNRLKESSKFIGWRAYIQKVIIEGNSKYTFTTGLEFFREKYNWSTFSNQSTNDLLSDNVEKRQYENLFIQLESAFSNRLFISAGLNGNFTRYNYIDEFYDNGDQSGEYSYKPVLSPRLGVNYLVKRELSVFGNVSHGFSTPTFEETLLPEGELNTDIKPESGLNTEFGIRTQITDRIQFSASYYRIYVKNLLVARRTGEDAYIGVNAGKSMHPGLETEIKWQVFNPKKFPSLTLSGNATFANYHFKDFVDEGVDYSGKNLPGTAKNTWLILANLNPTKNTTLNAWHRFTGEMAVNDANSDYSDSFGISNVEAKYLGKIRNFKYELKAGIQNLFDVHYASMLTVNAPSFGDNLPRYYYPGNPRNYYVSVLIGLE